MTLFFDIILIPLAIATLFITALREWAHGRLKSHRPPHAWRWGTHRVHWPSLAKLRQLQGQSLALTTLVLGVRVVARMVDVSWTFPTDLVVSLSGLLLAAALLGLGSITTWGLRHVSLCEGALCGLLVVSRALI